MLSRPRLHSQTVMPRMCAAIRILQPCKNTNKLIMSKKQRVTALEHQASAHHYDDEDEDEGLAKTPDSLHDHSFIINSQVRKISQMASE